MKNIKFLSCLTFVLSGATSGVFAADATLSYTDAFGIAQNQSESLGYFILEENARDVVFNTGTNYLFSKDLYLNAGRIENLELIATGNEDDARVYNKTTIDGNVKISGATGCFYSYGGTIESGAHFTLNGGRFDFANSSLHKWKIGEETGTRALISGTGTVTIRNTTLNGEAFTSWLQLDFANYDVLKKTKTLSLVDAGTIVGSGLNFRDISVFVDGWQVFDYTASLDWNADSVNFGKISITHPIPEPSAFGMLAGLCALAFAGTRRRRQ